MFNPQRGDCWKIDLKTDGFTVLIQKRNAFHLSFTKVLYIIFFTFVLRIL
jgi:hypothetical protein